MPKTKHRPPQRGRNLIQRSQERRDAENHIVQMWTAQACLDCMADVLNAEFGFGKDRLMKLAEAWNEKFPFYCRGIQRNIKTENGTDYADDARYMIDRRQREIFGEDAMTWSERYEHWNEV